MNETDLTVEEALRPEGRKPIPPDVPGPFPMLRYAATRYWWLVVLAALGGALVATRVPAVTGGGDFEAAAVVTARELVIDPELLPQTAGAIFNAGEVARTTVELSGVDADPNELIPDRVRLEPVENTIVLRVVATDTDPATAAALANGAARGLVMELQRLGAGVGRFSLHTPAAVPQVPVGGPPLPPALMGLLAGALFGVGLVGLGLAGRRPVIGPQTITSDLGVPVTGALALSSVDSSGDLRTVPHLATVTSRLFPTAAERRFLVGVHVRSDALRLLAIALARSLARSQKAALVGPGVSHLAFGTQEERGAILVDETSPPPSGIPTVVLGRFLPGDSEPFDPGDGWVLVVGQGAPLHEVRRALADLEDLPLAGVVLLRPLGMRDIARRKDPQLA